MIKSRKIKVGRKYILAFSLPLLTKKLIILRGSKGYVMCGYLDLGVAEKFKDVAIKVTGVSSIAEALRAKVFDCTTYARKLGISPGQPIKSLLKAIA